MNATTSWMLVRYVLIAGLTFLASHTGSTITPDQFTPVVDQIGAIWPALGALAVAAWGLYVKWNTKAIVDTPVPTDVKAARKVVVAKVVSPATGRLLDR